MNTSQMRLRYSMTDGPELRWRVERGHTILVMSGPAGPSLYLDDYRIAGPKPWGGGTVLYEFAFKDKDLIAAGVTLDRNPSIDELRAAASFHIEDGHSPIGCVICEYRAALGVTLAPRPAPDTALLRDVADIEDPEVIIHRKAGEA